MIRTFSLFSRKLLGGLSSALLLALLGVVCWQVISRYLLASPSTVSEELARLLLMMLGPLGAAYATAFKEHMAIDLLPQALTGQRRLRLLQLLDLLAAFFALLLIKGGWDLAQNALALDQRTAVLGLPVGYVYLTVPLGGLFMLIFLGASFVLGEDEVSP